MWRITTMVPRVWRAYKNAAALLIQRYMKGYYHKYKRQEENREEKLEANLTFFAEMKKKICNEA